MNKDNKSPKAKSKKGSESTPESAKLPFYKNDNFIIACEFAAIIILVLAIVFVLVGRNGGTDNSGNSGGISDGSNSGSTGDSSVKKTQYKATSFAFFDTITYIYGYEAEEQEFANMSREIQALLGEYHKLFDIYNEYDGMVNLCTLNKVVDGQHQKLKVDRKIIDMLLYAKEMYALTDGKMNVAMGSVLSIWHDYRTAGIDEPWNAELPPMDALTEAAKHTDINNVIIDEENSTVWLADPQMKLDVGAFAKGYAVEMVARMIEEKGKTSYTLNVGGNIRTIGIKGNGDKWKTGIENPNDTSENIEIVELEDQAIVTSGSYQRYYYVDSKSYHHIIDPDTLMPAEKGFLSVSVICKDSGMGDGLSTALFCMSLEEGQALVNSIDGVEAMWVSYDETKYYSNGFDQFIVK